MIAESEATQMSPGEERATILIVDDQPENLAVLADLLQSAYRVRAARSGAQAIRIAHSPPRPDLVLLDVMMPGMDGLEVLGRLRSEPASRQIPVILVTALSDSESEIKGLEAGAQDYICKPYSPAVVKLRVETQLELKRARDRLADHNRLLEQEVARRMEENALIQEASIRALAYLAEIRDMETGNHILRTQAYVRELAVRLREHPRFVRTLSDGYVEVLARSAPLHDIGKVGIPDCILRKPGPLSAEEWVVMRTHSVLGSDALERAERSVHRHLDMLALAKEIARSHHERWDGCGYPDGLSGESIPVSARLMAIADVFDALVSARVYKAPMTFEKARETIARGRGTQFDPDVADAFLGDYEHFAEIARRYADCGGDPHSGADASPPR